MAVRRSWLWAVIAIHRLWWALSILAVGPRGRSSILVVGPMNVSGPRCRPSILVVGPPGQSSMVVVGARCVSWGCEKRGVDTCGLTQLGCVQLFCSSSHPRHSVEDEPIRGVCHCTCFLHIVPAKFLPTLHTLEYRIPPFGAQKHGQTTLWKPSPYATAIEGSKSGKRRVEGSTMADANWKYYRRVLANLRLFMDLNWIRNPTTSMSGNSNYTRV